MTNMNREKRVLFCAGWAVSAYFGYLKGVSNELALKHVPYVVPRNDTLAGPSGRRGDQVPDLPPDMHHRLCKI
jgi:hypothetical protein